MSIRCRRPVAQDGFGDLAGGVARQGVDNADMTRFLVAGDAGAAMPDQGIFPRYGACFETLVSFVPQKVVSKQALMIKLQQDAR
jgi:hypothetical protein